MPSSSYAEEDSGAASICEGSSAGEDAKESSIFEEDFSVEQDSDAPSISGEDVSAEEDSNPSSNHREGGSVEEGSSESSGFSNCGGESAEEGLEYAVVRACSPENPSSKCVRQAMSEERSSGSPNLDVGLWSTLDDHLLEKIIARLPFKSFFRVSSSLSKTWRLRVQSSSFQRELYNRSFSWESYCPVYMNCKKELVGYESSSKRWHRLPTHSYCRYLQYDVAWLPRAGAGSLFCWTRPHFRPAFDHAYPEHVRVMNPLTRSWKQLPLRPEMHFPTFVHIDLEGSKAYKVILGTLRKLGTHHRDSVSIRVQIFDSTDESWAMEVYRSTGTNVVGSSVESTFMNGVLYLLGGPYFGRGYEFTVISLDVKNKVWSEIPLLFQPINEDPRPLDQFLILDAIHFYKILVCGSHVMMAIRYKGKVSNLGCAVDGDGGNTGDILSVFKLDVERGLAFEVSRAPNDLLSLIFVSQRFSLATAHGDCIYIASTYMSGYEPARTLILCNVGTRQWDRVPSVPNTSPPFHMMTSITYRPGLNSFLEV